MKNKNKKDILLKMNPRHRHRLNNKNNLTLGMKAVKFSLFFFNVMFLIFGISLIVIGSILSVQFKDFLDFAGKTHVSGVAGIIIALGFVITIISFTGSVGFIQESRCLILAFSGFLVVTFFSELVLVLIGFTFKEVMFRVLKDDMLKSFNSTEPGIIKSWNVIQRDFECCGYLDPNDWLKQGEFLPYSCCPKDFTCPSYDNPSFTKGCADLLTNWTTGNLTLIAVASLVMAIIQIFGTTFSCLLARSIKRRYGSV